LAPHEPLVITDRRLMFDVDRPADLALALRQFPELAARLSSLPPS
jgi:hypothetical protein